MATEIDAPGSSTRAPDVNDRSPANADNAIVPTVPAKMVSPLFWIWKKPVAAPVKAVSMRDGKGSPAA